ncbi:hypothetical protein ACL5HQ_17785 [Stenotrophomonas maltophilia]
MPEFATPVAGMTVALAVRAACPASEGAVLSVHAVVASASTGASRKVFHRELARILIPCPNVIIRREGAFTLVMLHVGHKAGSTGIRKRASSARICGAKEGGAMERAMGITQGSQPID